MPVLQLLLLLDKQYVLQFSFLPFFFFFLVLRFFRRFLQKSVFLVLTLSWRRSLICTANHWFALQINGLVSIWQRPPSWKCWKVVSMVDIVARSADLFRNCHNKMLRQKQSFADVLQKTCSKNFANLTGKHLCWNVFLIKLNFLWNLQTPFSRTPPVAASGWESYYDQIWSAGNQLGTE